MGNWFQIGRHLRLAAAAVCLGSLLVLHVQTERAAFGQLGWQLQQQAQHMSTLQQARNHAYQAAAAQALRHSPLHRGSGSRPRPYVEPRRYYYHAEPAPQPWVPVPRQIDEGDWVVTLVDAPAKRGSRRLTMVGAQSTLYVYEVRGDWVGVKFWQDDRYFEGWIDARYLARTPAPQPAEPAPALDHSSYDVPAAPGAPM